MSMLLGFGAGTKKGYDVNPTSSLSCASSTRASAISTKEN